MEFLTIVIKSLIILAMVLLMAVPFALEFFTFSRDKANKISYKRFRVVVYTGIYVVLITVAMVLLKELLLWLEGLSFVQWAVNKLAVPTQHIYFGKVFLAIILNFIIGMVYVLVSKLVRIGLKKRNLTEPAGKDGEFTKGQQRERKVIAFFYKETWFFVGQILKYLNILLSVVYALVFAIYQIPAVFSADWIPYEFISLVFGAGYLYPVITLLALWEMYFFLEGIKRLEDECPQLLEDEESQAQQVALSIEQIDEEVRKQFKDFYVCDVNMSGVVKTEVASNDHHLHTDYLAMAVENDPRNHQPRQETYLNCVDRLVGTDRSLLINGNFFSGFSMYFLRYLSAVIARGDNVVFVCNTETQIDAVYDYVMQGLTEISSLYCEGFRKDGVNFDEPIWRAVKVSGERNVVEEAAVDENSILVTSLGYLCSNRFEAEHSRFASLIDAVVFVDTLDTVNTFNRQLAILNTRLKHITKQNAVAAKNGRASDLFRMRYASRQVRYLCFDDTRTPGLDKVLKNMLGVELESVDAMHYNPSTLVRCYRYEGSPDENGRRTCPQFFSSEEEVGAVMNMAVLCLAKGASSVCVFADDIIPYSNIAETIASNMGQVVVKVDGDRIRLNKQFYNPDEYSVIIAMDSGDNLPATLRRYIATVSGKPALVIVFSRPYMLRDFYLSNIDKLWNASQIERIPVEEGTGKDVAQRILVKANAGGITKKEVLRLAQGASRFAELAAKEDLDGILRSVLEMYGASQQERNDLFRYFEYTLSQRFDEDGKFDSEVRVVLRRQGKLFEMINGRDMVVMVVGDEEITLPIPRSRMTQNFIVDQNLIHNGNIYYIQKMDTENGRIFARLAVSGMNKEVYQYVQDRAYTVELNPEYIEAVATKHVTTNNKQDDVAVNDVYISAFRAPMEVVTKGYFAIDPHTLAPNAGDDKYYSISDPGNDLQSKQVYRRYGQLTTPTYSSETVMKLCPKPSQRGAAMLSVRLQGEFGPDQNKTLSLAAAMLGEVLRSMFPSVADSIAVCPVLKGEVAGEDAASAMKKLPKLKLVGENELVNEEDFNLLIIEDCPSDLGVISVLMSAGDDILHTLFNPICSYLKWRAETDKPSDYLCYGLDHEPDCFDFETLKKLSALLGDDKHDLKFINLESVMEFESCDFCGKRYAKGTDVIELDDGRKMCKACASSLVGNNKKLLKAHLERAKTYLESTYGITMDDDYEFCFESTVKIVNTLKQNHGLLRRGSDAPLKSYIDEKKHVHIENSIPSANLSELLVRELTHVWQLKHLPELSEEMAEGHIALVGIQYLRFLNQPSIATARAAYYESADSEAGVGYRKLVRALLENPQYKNNPFLYLLEKSGAVVEETIAPPAPIVVSDGDYGLPYTPAQPDRVLNGQVPYFHYPRLTATCQQAYDQMLEAIRNHEESFMVSGCDMETMHKVSSAVAFDHPELFWYDNFGMSGAKVVLFYGATAEEAAVLQKRIDEAAAKYLEGIDDNMSAYDVALRLHVKMINSVDYDTVALEREKKAGGPAEGKIDYLRSICGVFLNGKAVCEGYARAMQYLLQKCGVECAEMAGDIRKENGESGGGHAWNILKVDGDYYYLDTTWDDSSSTVQSVKNTNLGFDYFCITTEELTRTRDLKFSPTDAPACVATRANYYYHNDAVLESYDLNKIKTIAQAAAKNNSKFFTFKCKTKALFEETLQRLCADGQDCFETLKFAAKADKKITESYTYGYDKNLWTITVHFKYK